MFPRPIPNVSTIEAPLDSLFWFVKYYVFAEEFSLNYTKKCASEKN